APYTTLFRSHIKANRLRAIQIRQILQSCPPRTSAAYVIVSPVIFSPKSIAERLFPPATFAFTLVTCWDSAFFISKVPASLHIPVLIGERFPEQTELL